MIVNGDTLIHRFVADAIVASVSAGGFFTVSGVTVLARSGDALVGDGAVVSVRALDAIR